jgi:hypothetical protein
MKIGLIFIAIFLLGDLSHAQAQKFRPATEADFVGYWRITLVPNEMHKSEFKNEQTGYSDPCQFFIHKKDGNWFNMSSNNGAGVEETKRLCPNKKRSDLDLSISAIRNETPYRWKKYTNQDGLFLVSDPSRPGSLPVLWKADLVLVDIPESAARGYDFKKGDLLMQLTRRINATTVAPVWPMVLRPVLD